MAAAPAAEEEAALAPPTKSHPEECSAGGFWTPDPTDIFPFAPSVGEGSSLNVVVRMKLPSLRTRMTSKSPKDAMNSRSAPVGRGAGSSVPPASLEPAADCGPASQEIAMAEKSLASLSLRAFNRAVLCVEGVGRDAMRLEKKKN